MRKILIGAAAAAVLGSFAATETEGPFLAAADRGAGAG